MCGHEIFTNSVPAPATVSAATATAPTHHGSYHHETDEGRLPTVANQHPPGSMAYVLSPTNALPNLHATGMNETRQLSTCVRITVAVGNDAKAGDLIDGGCNGGLAGENLLILAEDPH